MSLAYRNKIRFSRDKTAKSDTECHNRSPRSPQPPDRSTHSVAKKLALIRHFPLFRDFTPNECEQLASSMTLRTVVRGTMIFAKGDACTGLMAVLSGWVKIKVVSATGREALLNIVAPGEVMGEIALLDGRARSSDAVAISHCELMVMTRQRFIPLLLSHPEVGLKMIELLCRRLRHVSERLEDALFLKSPCRLAKTLLRLADQNVLRVLTQSEIGQIIGMSRESTNKQLRIWVDRKWIRLDRTGITLLKRDALAAVAAEDCDP